MRSDVSKWGGPVSCVMRRSWARQNATSGVARVAGSLQLTQFKPGCGHTCREVAMWAVHK
eukprot:300141-Prymnesium_polylepis.1